MSYQPLSLPSDPADSGRVMIIPESPFSIALEDSMLDTVRAIWQEVVGGEVDDSAFLGFEEKVQDTDTFG